jgi:phosphate transport system substrate-binding protein
MKKIVCKAIIVVFMMLVITLPCSDVNCAESLRYSCSAQIYEALSGKGLDLFTEKTGISMELYVASSGACVYRVMQDMGDIASTTRPIYQRHKDYGLVEIPFCKDPLAIITHKAAPVDSLSSEQLQKIFAGEIKNWKTVGGPDLPIILVVPGEETGANKNFRRQVMKLREFQYDYLTYLSTRVLEAIEELPVGAISFISKGAQVNHPDIKVLSINGTKPSDQDYPYYQIFYLVVNGNPTGSIKKFVDFMHSESITDIIYEKGMLPISNK